MKTMFELSDEVIGRAVPMAVEMGLPLDALLAFLLEGWTNPASRLRGGVRNSIGRRVGLTCRRGRGAKGGAK